MLAKTSLENFELHPDGAAIKSLGPYRILATTKGLLDCRLFGPCRTFSLASLAENLISRENGFKQESMACYHVFRVCFFKEDLKIETFKKF